MVCGGLRSALDVCPDLTRGKGGGAEVEESSGHGAAGQVRVQPGV
jgi:hypothetical protein